MDTATGQSTSLPRQLSPDEIDALRDVRKFSLLATIGFAISVVSVVVIYAFLGAIVSAINTPSQLIISFYGVLVVIGLISIGYAILLLVSFVFLRSGYRTLKGTSDRFNSPYTGINLYFAGLLVAVLGGVAAVGGVIAHSIVLVIGAIGIVLIGAIMSFVGEILGLILGSFRLKDHFNEHSFGTAGIMFIVGIFFSPLNLVGVILIYRGTNSLITASGTIKDWDNRS